MADNGNLYVIAAPSGTGKTTLVQALINSTPQITVSISHTTRAKRPNEEDGVNYYFIDETTFKDMVAHGDFLEHATVFDNHYGTSKNWVEQTLTHGMDVILEIDWQGYQQIKRLFPHAIGIFILPPSLKHLRERLTNRNQDNAATIEKRLTDARETASHIQEFDYVVVNDFFEQAVQELRTIVEASRLLTRRQVAKHSKLLKDLL